MKSPKTRIIEHDPNNSPSISLDCNDISSQRVLQKIVLFKIFWEFSRTGWVSISSLQKNKELVTVEMEGMRAVVEVINGNVDCLNACCFQNKLFVTIKHAFVNCDWRLFRCALNTRVQEAMEGWTGDVRMPRRLVEETSSQAPVANLKICPQNDDFVRWGW